MATEKAISQVDTGPALLATALREDSLPLIFMTEQVHGAEGLNVWGYNEPVS